MKITDQNIQLHSQHYLAEQRRTERVHETYKNGELATRDSVTLSYNKESFSQQSIGASRQIGNTLAPPLRLVDFPEREQVQENQNLPTSSGVEGVESPDKVSLPPRLQEMISAIEALMERLTGKEQTLKIYGYDNGEETNSPSEQYSQGQSQQAVSNPEVDGVPQEPSTGEYFYFNDFYQETEQTQFHASGSVTTADGRSIDFNLHSTMARQFTSELTIEKQSGVVMKDPLVINLNGQPASLTVDKFDFDLDADGKTENISFVNGQSGFLAFDKNQDGVINDGSELFGALTGKGFEELSQYDEDQNGWIDENDAIFSQLQVWQKDTNGFDQLSGLLELNIGAIYLKNAETEFALKDQNNDQHGQIRSSGVYLKEDGGAGTIQQIDLVV